MAQIYNVPDEEQSSKLYAGSEDSEQVGLCQMINTSLSPVLTRLAWRWIERLG